MAEKSAENQENDSKTTTEDSKPFHQLPSFEKEFEKKIKLSDGTEEYIFARGPKYSDELFPVVCFICRISRMNEKKIRSHLQTPKHVEGLAKATKTPLDAEEYRQPYVQIYSDRMNLKNPIKIYPGESIDELTTDYVDRLLPIKEFLWSYPPAEGYVEILKSDIIMEQNKKSPILGLCYGFKMAKDKKVAYYCGLCETELTELNAYQHFNGKEHFELYVKNHFPKTMETISQIEGITEDEKSKVIKALYQKFENWKGHRPFYLVNGKAFQATKDRFVQRAKQIYHYCDTTVIFSESELKEVYEKIKKRQLIVPQNPERLAKQPKTEKELTELPADVEEELPEIKEPEKKKSSRSRKRKSRNKSENKIDNKPKDDPNLNEKKRKLNLDNTPENWQKYRNLCQQALQSLEHEYERFLSVSTGHPKYREEWNRFYRRQCDVLRRNRINPNNYDFTPEWKDYWMSYLKECYRRDADKCKFEFRKTLRLPFRHKTPEPPNIFEGCNFNANNIGKNTSNIQSGPVPLMSVGSIFTGTNVSGNNMFGSNNADGFGDSKNQIPSLASLPSLVPSQQRQQQQQQQGFQQQPQPLISNSQQPKTEQQPIQQAAAHVQTNVNQNNAPTSVMSVLRLLAALETELGSLGPIANQLLGKAILYEKESKQSANELLHETEYFTLFGTSLEKLKGLVLAGLLPELKVTPTKNVISDLEKIMNLFEEYLRRNPDAAKNHIPSSVILRKHNLPAVDPLPNTQVTPNTTNNQISANNFNARQTDSNQFPDKKWNNENNSGPPENINQRNQNMGSNNYDRQNYNNRNNFNENPQRQNNDFNRNRQNDYRNDYNQNPKGANSNMNNNQWQNTGNNYNQQRNYDTPNMNQDRRDSNYKNDFNRNGNRDNFNSNMRNNVDNYPRGSDFNKNAYNQGGNERGNYNDNMRNANNFNRNNMSNTPAGNKMSDYDNKRNSDNFGNNRGGNAGYQPNQANWNQGNSRNWDSNNSKGPQNWNSGSNNWGSGNNKPNTYPNNQNQGNIPSLMNFSSGGNAGGGNYGGAPRNNFGRR